jgi:hypothetical protein
VHISPALSQRATEVHYHTCTSMAFGQTEILTHKRDVSLNIHVRHKCDDSAFSLVGIISSMRCSEDCQFRM